MRRQDAKSAKEDAKECGEKMAGTGGTLGVPDTGGERLRGWVSEWTPGGFGARRDAWKNRATVYPDNVLVIPGTVTFLL
jgi:hypothetical protein